MKTEETIKVFIRIVAGKTVCICARSNKGCNRKCEKDVVTRDKFKNWESTMNKDKFGH